MIERTNQHILTTTIVSMLEAGLPPCYWSFAAPCVALNMNTDFENGESAHALTHGEEFSGKRFPFGSKVLYKPSSTKESDSGKWDLAGSVGVFAGYVIHPGYLFKGEYLVWDLKDFSRGADLSNMATNMGQRIYNPHVSVRCELYDGQLSFPLKSEYERVNSTFEGQKEAFARHPVQGVNPTHPPPDHHVDGGGNSADGAEGVEPPVVVVPVAPVAPHPQRRCWKREQ